MKKSLLRTTWDGNPGKVPVTEMGFYRAIIGSVVVSLLVVAVQLWMPQASKAQSASLSNHEAICRDSRFPLKSNWPLDEAGTRRLHLEVDIDGDGLTDVLEARYSSGSASASTSVEITFGRSGDRLRAEETFEFSQITAVNLVPKELLVPGHHGALKLIEEVLFPRICESPDPSLAWLLDTTKRLTWIEGPPKMPDFYAMRLPVRGLAGPALERLREAEGTLDPNREVWVAYAGHVHSYPGRDGRTRPVVLSQDGDRVLLGTAHGVILTNPERSKHAWIYVFQGDNEVKLRFPSISGACFQGDIAIITLVRTQLDSDSRADPKKSKPSQARVNLKTGRISK